MPPTFPEPFPPAAQPICGVYKVETGSATAHPGRVRSKSHHRGAAIYPATNFGRDGAATNLARGVVKEERRTIEDLIDRRSATPGRTPVGAVAVGDTRCVSPKAW